MPPLKIGHRGAAGTRPELTRASFERAIELGVDMVELDVQLTRDRRLVVLHDRELGRTVRTAGNVRDFTLAELCALDAGSWFDTRYAAERVLSLDDVLDLTTGRIELNVEIKSPAPDWAATAEVLVALLKDRGRIAPTVVSCFEMGALGCVREVSSEARLGVLWQAGPLAEAWSAASDLRAASFHPHWALVDEETMGVARERGLAVFVWTVNDPETIRRMAVMGVDGIITDFPERLSEGL